MKENNSKAFLLILLGALTAFGPLVTDMYLPSLPTMTGYFDTNSSMVQLGLTSSMIGLAIGQIFFGPLSDKYGRRPLLLISMLLFIVSTVFCIFSPNIESFIAFRLLQGIAGSGGIVISRSVATDKFSGQDLAKAMAIIGAINGIAPVASPVLGGFLTDSIGWKGIFIILLIIGIILLIGNFRFKESLPKSNRKSKDYYGDSGKYYIIVVMFSMCSKWDSPWGYYSPTYLHLLLSCNNTTVSQPLHSVCFLE